MALSYFSKLPIIEYPLDRERYKKARDILHRLFFDQKVIDKSEYVKKYQVKDSDRLEIISNKLYSRTDLYSIIMLLNNFDTTMFSGLPPMSSVYDQYLDEKYSEDVYYILPLMNTNDLTAVASGYSGGYVFPLLQKGFTPGEKIFVVGSDGNISDNRAYVKEWNPVMSALKLDIIEGSFYDGATIGNQYGTADFRVSMKKKGKDAIHHFEAIISTTGGYNPLIKGMEIDPLSRFDILSTGSIRMTPIGISANGITGAYGTSIIYQHNLLKSLVPSQKNYIKAVTNSEYEEQQQEKKRWINVPTTDNVMLLEVINKVSGLLESTTG